jgi:DNA-binding XRE family transcriptional regulator
MPSDGEPVLGAGLNRSESGGRIALGYPSPGRAAGTIFGLPTPLLQQTVVQKCSSKMCYFGRTADGGGSRIVRRMSNLVSGRQIRAARMLAGITQADLARAAGCHPRSVRYWESKGNNSPTNVVSTLDSIEQALNRHGVILFSTPTPGVRSM